MKYIATGNVMLDSVRRIDSREYSRKHIGGPATFAYSGMKLWTDDVMQCCNVGADYREFFGPWFEKNQIETRGFKIKCDKTTHLSLIYNLDGTYGMDPDSDGHSFSSVRNIGYMRTSPREIGALTSGKDVKGVYIWSETDHVYWDELDAIKRRDGFKVMWEIESQVSVLSNMDNVLYALITVDIFSINLQEAQTLFKVEGDDACIRQLQKLPVDMTLFRVGERGLYVVTPGEAIYLPPAPGPVVDATGCGNCSTGAALYAYGEGFDPLMIGIIANVAASYNIRQYGVIPDFAAVREEAYEQAKKLYDYYKNKEGFK